MVFRNASKEVKRALKGFCDNYRLWYEAELENDGTGTYRITLDDYVLQATITREEVILKGNNEIVELHISKDSFYKFEIV